MSINKRCGNCFYFIKWRNNGFKNSALCEAHDGRTDSGNKGCDKWKGIKYIRPQKEYKES